MAGWAAAALIAAFLIQNIEELLTGGPPPPPFLRGLSDRARDRVRLRAVVMVSILVPVVLIASLAAGWWQGAMMIAAALAANALVQIGQSLWRRRVLPGTVTGTALMLPAAIWLSVALGKVPGKPVWAALGVIAMPPVLVLIWLIAARTR